MLQLVAVSQRMRGHRLARPGPVFARAGSASPLVLSAVLLILLAGGVAAGWAFRMHSAGPACPAPAAQLTSSSEWQPANRPAAASSLEWDTNLAAMLAAAALRFEPAAAGWWVDSSAAIAIALVLTGRWAAIARVQVGRAGQLCLCVEPSLVECSLACIAWGN